MDEIFSGRIWRVGDDIDTDIIMATQYLAFPTVAEMLPHAFEPLRGDLAAAIRPGDILVAGRNFGCGSSREMAATVLKELGLRCVIARSFAKIFFRNAINNGLLLVECDGLYDGCREGDTVTVEPGEAVVCNGVRYPVPGLSGEAREILHRGGLVPRMRALDKDALPPRPPVPEPPAAGGTLIQQILRRNTGAACRPGDVVTAWADMAILHDIYTPYIHRQFTRMGFTRAFDPERAAVMQDHLLPTQCDEDPRCFRYSRRFQEEFGVRRLHAGDGICHQVAAEEGYARPGTVVFGTDSHTTTCGAFGCFGTGVGFTEMAAILGTGQLWLRVPQAILVEVEGRLPPGVSGKDIILRVLGDLRADGALYRSLEFCGSAVDALCLSDRMAMANMAVECGAKAALFQPDAEALAVCGMAASEIAWLRLDRDAPYERVLRYRAEELEPCLACPPTVDNVRPLRELEGTRVDQVFLGSCTNGRLEDLAAAAAVLAGKHIPPRMKLIVTPASRRVYQEAVRRGILQTLVRAGAMVTHPYGSLCQGRGGGLAAAGEVVVGTHNRNFIGRMGSPEAQVYLASPAVGAAPAPPRYLTNAAD